MTAFVHSYSKIADFENCPKKFAHRYIWKDALPFAQDAPALVKGRMIDEGISAAISTGAPLPALVAHMQPIVDQLRTLHGVRTKYKIGLNAAWREVEYFRGEGLRWRTEIDYIGFTDKSQKVAEMIDWKTGKVSKDLGQLSLYAAVVLATMPWVERVRTRYIWVEHKKSAAREFVNSDFAPLCNKVESRAASVEFAVKRNKFEATKNALCPWCPIRPDQCMHKTETIER